MTAEQRDVLKAFYSIETTDEIQPNFEDVKVVAENIDAIIAFANSVTSGNIDTVALDSTAINTLYSITDALNSIYADKTTLDSIYADKTTLDSIYASLSELNTIVSNIVAIQNAESNANLASEYATQLEDVYITGTTNYSAYHYMKKAEAFAGGVTFEALNANGDVGTGADQVAQGNHTHTDLYEPKDATILKDADIGVTVQAYDATIVVDADIVNMAETNVINTFTASQRGAITTDNDGSFDLNITNNFSCAPSGTFALTFTNISAGQSGQILLDNSGGHIITADTNTKIDANFLSTVSTAGVYVLGYFSSGTSVYVYNTGAME